MSYPYKTEPFFLKVDNDVLIEGFILPNGQVMLYYLPSQAIVIMRSMAQAQQLFSSMDNSPEIFYGECV